jgi:flavodoxin
MFEVIYYSLTGRTRKVAEAIADELGVAAEDVKSKEGLARDSFVFLGAGKYGPLRGWGLKQLIESNDFHGRKVALFGTSGNGAGQEVEALEELVVAQGADVVGSFFCAGEFLLLVNRNHPDSRDLEDARRFARELAAA